MNLLVAETILYGESFLLGQQLSEQGHRILEIAPFGHQGYFLAEVFDLDLTSLRQQNKNAHFALIKNVHEDLLSAYLSLKSHPVQQYILFLTFEGPVAAFETAEVLLRKNFNVVDFRFLKHKKPSVHLILTSDDEASFKDLNDEMKKEAVFFKTNGEFLKDYFSIIAT